MRILTVRQPWAWAIIHGGKDIENRSRSLGPYRGPVAIHAASQFDVDARERGSWPALRDALAARPDRNSELSLGVILGVVDLVDVHEDDSAACYSCSDWADYGWHHVLANPRPLAESIAFRGGLGLRQLHTAAATAVLEAIA